MDKEQVEEVIKQMVSNNGSSKDNEVQPSKIERSTLTVEEVAEYIGVSKDLIYDMVRKNDIPYIRIGKKRILFKRQSIDQWLSEKEAIINE